MEGLKVVNNRGVVVGRGLEVVMDGLEVVNNG